MQTAPTQFTLLALFVAMTAFCFLLGAIAVIGFAEVTVVLVGLGLLGYGTAVWGAFYAVAPEAAKYSGVVGTILFMLIAPLPMVLQQQREASRRAACLNNLRTMGVGMHERELLRPEETWEWDASLDYEARRCLQHRIQVMTAVSPLEASILRDRGRDERAYPFASPVYFQP